MKNWTFNKTDREFVQKIKGFLPKKVFDSHAHLYLADLENKNTLFAEGPAARMTLAGWRRQVEKQVGENRLIGGLFTAPPFLPEYIDRKNDYLVAQLKGARKSKGLILITPDYPAEKVDQYLQNSSIAGFKPYHTFSRRKPTFQAPVSAYLPEWAWKMAHERGLVILLHLVRDRALSDPDNLAEIIDKCRKYPGARLILAHAGRGFHPDNTVKGLPALRGLENIWFDAAAICEPAALLAILREFGPRKLMWGSDFPISEMRGKCVAAGDGFIWLSRKSLVRGSVSPDCNPTLTGLESLNAVREAAEEFGLNAADLQDIFCDNALRLLDLKEKAVDLTENLYRYAKTRIPGGTQLLSKRPEMMAPDQWPAYFREARGCETWDLDGRHYYDMHYNGISACLLGFRNPEVTQAVIRRVNLGSMCTLNPPEEVELADLLCRIHPWAEQVRFTRTGGETGAVAVRIARATTDRSAVAICGYHGWHDWYVAANLGENDALRGHLLNGIGPLGVPRELRNTALTFTYNNRAELQSIVDKHGDRLAAVIMEPCRNLDPEPGFLEFVRDKAHQCGALLIFDEVSIGWRLHFGGAHLRLGVNPDLAMFAKAMGNGHPIGAVLGTKEAMAGTQQSFISSTYWTESVGPAAALATLKVMQRIDVPAYVARIGQMVRDNWRRCGEKHRLPVKINEQEYPCLAHFRFDHELSEELRTLLTQLMLKRGFLAGTSISPTLAHTDRIVSLYNNTIDEVFGEMAEGLKKDRIRQMLKGPVAHSGFKRLIT